MLPDTCLKARVHASACQIPYTRYTSFGNCSRERSRERECSGTGIIDLLLMDTHARVRLSSGLADVIFGAVVTCNTVQQIFGFTGHRQNNKEFNQKTDCSLFRDTNTYIEQVATSKSLNHIFYISFAIDAFGFNNMIGCLFLV